MKKAILKVWHGKQAISSLSKETRYILDGQILLVSTFYVSSFLMMPHRKEKSYNMITRQDDVFNENLGPYIILARL